MKTKPEHGCIIAGHWGIYATPQVVEMAVEHGMKLDNDDIEAMSLMDTPFAIGYEDAWERVTMLADEAEAWLNDNVAEDGSSFGWYDGEFFYQPTGWWDPDPTY